MPILSETASDITRVDTSTASELRTTPTWIETEGVSEDWADGRAVAVKAIKIADNAKLEYCMVKMCFGCWSKWSWNGRSMKSVMEVLNEKMFE
jgi:hypothetical protein